MFTENKYSKWYNSIITKALLRIDNDGYTEKHHILPRSLGGSDDPTNLVILTAKEHFVCHLLLPKFTEGLDRHKMIYAANFMCKMSREYQTRYKPSARIYEMLRKQFASTHSKSLRGKTYEDLYGDRADEMRTKVSAHRIGKKQSDETIAKRVEKLKGQVRTEEQRQTMSASQLSRKPSSPLSPEKKLFISKKISDGLKGKIKTDEHRANLATANRGKTLGIAKSEETKQRMRKPKTPEHRKAISDARIAKYAALRASKP